MILVRPLLFGLRGTPTKSYDDHLLWCCSSSYSTCQIGLHSSGESSNRSRFHGESLWWSKVGSENHHSSTATPWMSSHHSYGLVSSIDSTSGCYFISLAGFIFLFDFNFFFFLKQIVKEIRQDLSDFNCGLAHVFCKFPSLSVISLSFWSFFFFC